MLKLIFIEKTVGGLRWAFQNSLQFRNYIGMNIQFRKQLRWPSGMERLSFEL